MKKLVLLVVGLAVLSSFAFAAETANTTVAATSTPVQASETMTLKGDIIDNLCAGMQTPEKLAEFVKTHTKECALRPSYVASGYSIFSDGKLQKFDLESNAKIEGFLKKADSKLQVSVVVKKVGDVLSLVSIENQK